MERNSTLYIVFIALFILAILNAYFFQWLESEYFDCGVFDSGLNGFTPLGVFFLVVLVAPIVETFVFIQLPYETLLKINVHSNVVRTILSAALFSVLHLYCALYIVMTFIGGLIMNFLYIFSAKRRHYPFWTVAVFHALYNCYGFVFVN